MRYLFILLCLISFQASAQINSPDTACINTQVNFTAANFDGAHTWVMDTTDISQYNNANATASSSFGPVSNPVFSSMTNDNGNWYSFTTNYSNKRIIRFDYGGNPNNTPTATDMGTFGFPGIRNEGIQILKDSVSGNWYGFVVNYQRMMRLDFGTSLGNTPTPTFFNFPGDFAWAHQIGIAKYGNEWIGFVANRNGNITRLEFGASITNNTPTLTVLPKVGSYNTPCGFALHQQGGNWYMLVTNLIDGTISRLNFGINIKNNTPTGTLLGAVGSLPRTVAIFKDCNQLIAYVINEGGILRQLDFHNDITTAPTFTSMGNIGVSSVNSFVPYVYNGTQYLHLTSFASQGYHRKTLFTYPTFNTTAFYNPAINYTFTTGGTKNVTVLHNPGEFMGSYTHCKSIYIATNATVDVIKDTALCQGDSVILDASASGATTYQWNTTATSSSIKVGQAGKYWVTLSGGAVCGSTTDTAELTTKTKPSVDLDSFVKCAGTLIKLENKNNNPAGATYLWSNSSTGESISFLGTPNMSGKYWLEVSDGGCKGSDTATVQVNPVPAVYLGPDTTVCTQVSYTLDASPQANGTSYLWSNNSTDSTLNINSSGTYSVTVTNTFNCTAADTVTVTKIQGPNVNLGNDTTLCYGESVTLYAGITNIPVTYVWSDSSTKDRLKVSTPGVYTLYAFSECGLLRDDVAIDFRSCELHFPSAFTPNGDGRNDIAKVLGDLALVTNFELGIFNRWGNRVFYTTNPYEGWDGKYKGTEQDMNVFYYYIKYKFEGKDRIMEGSITLLR